MSGMNDRNDWNKCVIAERKLTGACGGAGPGSRALGHGNRARGHSASPGRIASSSRTAATSLRYAASWPSSCTRDRVPGGT